MKKSGKIGVLLGAVLAAGIIFAIPAGTRIAQAAQEETIAEGVYIGSIDVGGMTEEEAKAAVEAYVENAGDAVFTLSAGEKSIEVKAEELGTYQR